METTKNNLTKNEKNFFNGVSKYLESPLYFYGSIQRNDYLQGQSDIDTVIFTDNETATISKLINYLHIKKSKIKGFVIEGDTKIIKGSKIFYEDPSGEFFVEFAIINYKNRESFLDYHSKKYNLPFYISFILIIIKFFYYQLGILPQGYYSTIKNLLMTYGLGLPRVKFVRFDEKI